MRACVRTNMNRCICESDMLNFDCINQRMFTIYSEVLGLPATPVKDFISLFSDAKYVRTYVLATSICTYVCAYRCM